MQATAVNPPATADAVPRRDRFLVLLPRLAQVHVHVDEARTDHEARRHIDDLAAVGQRRRQIASDLRDRDRRR